MGIILNFLGKIPANIKRLITYVIIGVIAYFVYMKMYNKIEELAAESTRNARNIVNINSAYEALLDKNGEIYYSINDLNLNVNELQKVNEDLASSVVNLGVKLKNLNSVGKVEYHYETRIDTLKPVLIADKLYRFEVKDEFMDFSTNLTLNEKFFDGTITIEPQMENLTFRNKDTLLIANEFITKRHWIFWKKIIGTKTHVKSESPYFNLDRMEFFQMTQK